MVHRRVVRTSKKLRFVMDRVQKIVEATKIRKSRQKLGSEWARLVVARANFSLRAPYFPFFQT